MRLRVAAAAIGLVCAGCATEPQKYLAGLSSGDPKWQSGACKAVRARTDSFEQEEKEKLKSSIAIGMLSPSGALATTNVTNQHNVRLRQFNRELHLKCSSAPLPDDLQNIPEIQAPRML